MTVHEYSIAKSQVIECSLWNILQQPLKPCKRKRHLEEKEDLLSFDFFAIIPYRPVFIVLELPRK